jgi:hypothetical protein
VVWNIPCDPNNTAIVSEAFPRLAGEGLLCYIIRVFEAFISGGNEVFSPFLNWTFTGNGSTTTYSLPNATALLSAAYLVYIDGVVQAPVNYTIASGNPLTIVFSTAIPNGSQVVIVCMGSASQGTLDGVTINGATINTATINNLTATGTLALPAGSVTSAMILNGTIVPADLSAGGPTWNTGGTLTATSFNGSLTGNVTGGSVIGTNTVNIESAYNNLGLGVFFTGGVNADYAPKRRLALYTTMNGTSFSKLNSFPLEDQDGTILNGSDPSLAYFNGAFHIAVGLYLTNSYDCIIYRSTNLIDWTTFAIRFGSGIRVTDGTAPNYTQTFPNGPSIWAPQWYLEGSNVYIINAIQAKANTTDVDGQPLEFMRPYISQCTNLNTLTFGTPTEFITGDKSQVLIDGCIYKYGVTYNLLIANARKHIIEHWTNSALNGTWTYVADLPFEKYTEAPSVFAKNTSTGTQYIIYGDNYFTKSLDGTIDSTSTMKYCTTTNFTAFSAVANVTCETRLRHGDALNLANTPKVAFDALIQSSAILKSSFDPLAYGVAKAWARFKGGTPNPAETLLTFNVSSISRTGVGVYSINLNVPLLPVGGSFQVTTDYAGSGALTHKAYYVNSTTIVLNFFQGGTTTYIDPTMIYFVGFGN